MIPFASFTVLQVYAMSPHLGSPIVLNSCAMNMLISHGRVHTARIASDSGSNSALFIYCSRNLNI